MKKITSVLISAGLLAMTLAPMAALAQPQNNCTLRHDIAIEGESFSTGDVVGAVGSGSANETNTWGLFCIMDAIMTVTDWVFYFLVAITAFLTIWGGFSIATAGGDAGKVGEGRQYILYAMIGLAVALLSRAIPAVVQALIS